MPVAGEAADVPACDPVEPPQRDTVLLRKSVEEPALLIGGTAAQVYGLDTQALRKVADRVGPTPEDLGQDRHLRTDPAAVAKARWWKDEYQVVAPGTWQ